MQQPGTDRTSKKTSFKKRQRHANIANYMWCTLCKVYLPNSGAMQEHEKTNTHILNKSVQEDGAAYVKQENENLRFRRETKMKGPKGIHYEYNIANLWREICEAEGTKGANFLFAATNVFVCRPCQATTHVTEILKHVHESEHQDAIRLQTNIDKNLRMIREEDQLWERVHPAFQTHQPYMRIQDEKHLFCFLCEKNVPATNSHNLLAHVASKNHMKNVILYLQSAYSLLTGICLNPHIQQLQQLSNPDQKALRMFEKITEPTDDTQLRKLHSLLNEINSKTEEKPVRCKCLLCDLEFDSGALWLNHFNEEFHEQNVKNMSKVGKKVGKYVCHVCNTIMCGDDSSHPCVDEVDGLLSPRIYVSGYNNETKLESLYDALQAYGTITNCAQTSVEAIFEFKEREAVHELLRNQVKLEGCTLQIEPLKFEKIKDSAIHVQLNPYLEEILSSTEKFNSQVEKLCQVIDSACNQTSDHEVAKFLEQELSKAFNKIVTTYIFGSRVSGIAFPDSDVDIFADTGHMYDGSHGQEVSAQDHIVTVTTDALKAHPDCVHVVAVPKARTPIVKFKYKPTDCYCDIAFRHGLGCENTKLIRFYLSLDPSIKPLMAFLKYWTQVHGLSGRKAFTSYSLVWLVIFFLQQLPDINFPTVEELQKNVETKTIAGWNCGFNDDRSALTVNRIPHSVLQLVCEFFKFYSEFDFLTFVVCPLTGRPEPKMMLKRSPTNLPETMKEYVKQLRYLYYDKLSLSACCVQDPFELNHNVSKGASCDTVNRFQHLCSLAVELCSQLDC